MALRTKFKLSTLSTFGLSGVALACAVGIAQLLGPPSGVQLTFMQAMGGGAAIHKAVANALDSMYGSAYNGREVFIQAVMVVYPGGTIKQFFPFSKPCDKTFKEAGESDDAAYAAVSGGGGGDSGPTTSPASGGGSGSGLPTTGIGQCASCPPMPILYGNVGPLKP